MGCGPFRFLIGAGATVALAGIGYYLTDAYGGAQGGQPTLESNAPEVATLPATPAETPATAEQVASCQTQVDGVIKGQTIQFDSGTATIKADSVPLIDALATALTPCAGTVIEVAGHTDLVGDEAANMTLSEQRANAVVQALVAKNVPTSRLAPKGYGETKPAQPGEGEAANVANRRIEFAVRAVGADAAAGAAAPDAATAAPTEATGQ